MGADNGDVLCPDAVVILPGILGSELVDRKNKVIWGLKASSVLNARLFGGIYDQLVDDQLEVGGLLKLPVSVPILGRVDPYTDLVEAVRSVVVDDAAVLEYPYDWRRPVQDVAQELATAAKDHLQQWRDNDEAKRIDFSDVQLSFVCHSMGGLVAQHAVELCREVLDPTDVRQLITLGTPFGGSVKAVRAMSTGEVVPGGWSVPPWVKSRLCRAAVQVPGLHDLLPTYRRAAAGLNEPPTASELASAGADLKLAGDALTRKVELEEKLAADGHVPATLQTLVGAEQQTLQSFSAADGEVQFAEKVDGRNWYGDGTVYLGAATPKDGGDGMPVPNSHGGLAKTPEALTFVKTKLRGGDLGPPQAGPPHGLLAPEVVERDEVFQIRIRAEYGDVSLRYVEPMTDLGDSIDEMTVDPESDELHVDWAFRAAGLYTLTLSGGGYSDIQTDIFVLDKD